MDHDEINSGRLEDVANLALLRTSVVDGIEAMSQYEWHFDGIPFTLRKEDVRAVLNRFLDGLLTASDLELWADAIEMREDISFDKRDRDWIADRIAILSSPEINGEISVEAVRAMAK